MNFKIDKQTLTDLAILGTGRGPSVYEIFNRTHTRGGSRLLEEMFCYPLTDEVQIRSREEAIRYYMDRKTVFPFQGAMFDAIEFYLNHTDTRSQLMAEDNTLERRMKTFLGTDTDYAWIQEGIAGCLELLNGLHEFLKEMEEGKYGVLARQYQQLELLLQNEKWSWYAGEKGRKKIAYEQAVVYDKVFRYEERDRLLQLLYYVYLTDVYITVAQVAGERGFHFACPYPAGRNVLKMKEVFHPFLKNPVKNTLELDASGNVVFLTGANMAGKSTFMKAFGIAVFLAHAGFPVPATEMEFSVREGMFTTINLPDNLSRGYSHFYAEVLRVKKVAQLVRESRHLVVVFDELFRGTNVKDAYDATLAVTEAFAEIRDCIFMISTHIIEVGEALQKSCDNVRFWYLPTRLEEHKPVYSYTLTEGISNDRHGMIIVNNEHIIELINGKEEEHGL